MNTSVYVFDAKLLAEAIANLKSNNAQGEFYLTDALEAAIKGLTLKSQAPGGNKGDGTQSGTHKGDDISKTGADVQVFAIIIALATCAGLGAVAYARRRREA